MWVDRKTICVNIQHIYTTALRRNVHILSVWLVFTPLHLCTEVVNLLIPSVLPLMTCLRKQFEGPRRAFDAGRLVLVVVACFIFFFWVASTDFFCKVNSLFSLPFHHEGLALAQAWHSADIWWSESLSRSERRKISRTEWWQIAGRYQSRMVHRSGIFVLWGQREIIWSEDVLVTRKSPVARKPLSAISPVAGHLYAFLNSSPVW